jgi:hypothetical protein
MWFEMALYIVSILYLAWFLFIFLLLCAYYFLAPIKNPSKQAKPASTDETGFSSSGANTSTSRATPSIATITEDDIDSELYHAGVCFVDDYPTSKAPSISTAHWLTRTLLGTIFIHKRLEDERFCCLAPASPAVRAKCEDIFPRSWDRLSYSQCYIALMSICRTDTLGGKLGQSIRRRIRADLLANEESKESLDGQFARIAIHLQQPVCVWDSEEAEVIEGVLEEFLPVYDSNKVLRTWKISVSARHFQGSMTRTGTISELFTILSKTESFE